MIHVNLKKIFLNFNLEQILEDIETSVNNVGVNIIKNGKAINLSSGKFTSFISLSTKILNSLGKKNIHVLGNSTKPEGVFARGGSTLLQKKYGFVPKISLDQGIIMAIDFFKKNS